VRIRTKTPFLGALVVLALPLVLGGAAGSAAAATAPPVGAFANAYGLLVDVTLLQGNAPVKLGPYAPIASSCLPETGVKTTQALGAGDQMVARADVLNTGAATDCGAKSAMASAQTLNADALGVAAAVKIHSDEITSTSTTTCADAPKGKTVIANLTVGGTAVPLPTTVAPNTEILAPVFNPLGLRVIVNEQHPAASGRGLVVNGLHIIATGAVGPIIRGDIIISHAESGVVCPGGPGSDLGGLPKPDISFAKSASPKTAKPGSTVTYTATVTNTSANSCDVLRFVDHISPVFDLVSTAGAFGEKLDTPAPARTDGGVDAVLRPKGIKLDAGKSLVQTFTVTLKDGVLPGTYYNSLEIFCGLNGDFVSGPLAPVTVPAAIAPPSRKPPVKVVKPPPQLPRTGGAPLAAAGALLLLTAAGGLYRMRQTQR